MNVLTLATICMISVGAMTATGLTTTAMADGVLPPDIRAKATGEVVWWDASGGALTRARDETTNKHFTEETGVTLGRTKMWRFPPYSGGIIRTK